MKEKTLRIKIIRAMLSGKLTVSEAVAMQGLSGQALWGAAKIKNVVK